MSKMGVDREETLYSKLSTFYLFLHMILMILLIKILLILHNNNSAV